MKRVTPRDRDRAVARLGAATGAVTAGSLALTGAFLALAKSETDTKNARKAELKAQQAQQARLRAQRAAHAVDQVTESDPQGDTPTVHVYSTSAPPVRRATVRKVTAKRAGPAGTSARKRATEHAAAGRARPATRTTPAQRTTTRQQAAAITTPRTTAPATSEPTTSEDPPKASKESSSETPPPVTSAGS